MFVETKKDGETQTLRPSLQGFIAWAETKDPREEYDYWNCDGACLLGQYFNSIGLKWTHEGGPGCILFNDDAAWDIIDLRNVSCELPRTFGAAATRARKALAAR